MSAINSANSPFIPLWEQQQAKVYADQPVSVPVTVTTTPLASPAVDSFSQRESADITLSSLNLNMPFSELPAQQLPEPQPATTFYERSLGYKEVTANSVEILNEDNHINLNSPENPTGIKKILLENASKIDKFAYNILLDYLKENRPDNLGSLEYYLDNQNRDQKTVAYTDNNGFHLATFTKDKNGVWSCLDDIGNSTELTALAFESAVDEALPNAVNVWTWSSAENQQGTITKQVRTTNGLQLESFINGLDKQKGKTFLSTESGLSISGNANTDTALLSVNFPNGWELSGRYNFSGDVISGLGGNMGSLNGSALGALRKQFDNLQLSLSYGYLPHIGELMPASTSNQPLHMVALGANYRKDLLNTSFGNSLNFKSTFEQQISLPLFFSDSGADLALSNSQNSISSTLHNHLNWNITNNLTFNGGYTAALDWTHTDNNIQLSPVLNQYAEVGLSSYIASKFLLSFNLYAPITIYDDRYEDNFRWNVGISYKYSPDLSVEAALDGKFSGNSASANFQSNLVFKNKYKLSLSAQNISSDLSTMSANIAAGFKF